MAAAWWVASAGVLIYVSREPTGRSRLLAYFLAALWLWNAAAYHALLFTRINPAAWLFSAAFAAQAAMFVRDGSRDPVQYFSSSGLARTLGLGFMLYALAYPLLTIAIVHDYPATPTFGVPCPTAILTIGLFLTARRGVPFTLVVVPLLWSLVGGSAAVLFSVATDYVLMAAGAVLTMVLIAKRTRPTLAVR